MFKKPIRRPMVATIIGDAGTGKTHLGASFPDPVFIRAEDGVDKMENPPDAGELIKTVDILWEQLTYLIKNDNEYKTVVIDSVTKLENIFINHIIDNDPKKPKSLNQALGGYMAGYEAVAKLHWRVRNACRILNEQKKMNVLFLAHADLEKIDPPDMDPYSRYSMRMNKKSISPYIDDVDLVGFIRLVTYTHGDGEKKKAVSTGDRELITFATAANVSKNRYGITEPLTVNMGENPLAQYL